MSRRSGRRPPAYLHGYTPDEQARLVAQARFLEPKVFAGIDFSEQSRVIELGCGVGAEMEILLERFPDLHVHGVDAERAQIARARRRLAAPIRAGQASVAVGDATALPDPDGAYDGGFLCWFLEHVPRPVEVLRELRRVLRPGSPVWCSEVLNATLFVHPRSAALERYWAAANEHQTALGGDPFVGGKLGNVFRAAGFADVVTEPRVFHYDDRSPRARARMLEYWASLLKSSGPGLVKAGRIAMKDLGAMERDLGRIAGTQGAVFFYSFVQARARA